MSATRGRDAVPQRRMTSSPASSRRRTSFEYCAPRLARRCCAITVATSSSGPAGTGSGIAFCIIRILFFRRRSERTMAWDFETEPEFQAKLDWAKEFVREGVEPLDLVWRGRGFK